MMANNNKDFEVFAREYQNEEKEILILTSDDSYGAMKSKDSWEASYNFLAYVDVASNELKMGNGRIHWLISDAENSEHGPGWPYYLKKGVIYLLKVRELVDKTVPEGRMPSFYNRFMVVDVIEENANNDDLLAILAEYRKPVIITDKALGEFELDKDFEMFEGTINWLGKDISAYLEVNIDNKGSWTKTMNALRSLYEQQEQRDAEFRSFAAKQLTPLANDWNDDEDAVEISEKDFADRIRISSLTVTSGGGYTAYYDDDDLFFGHAVTVYGTIKKGIKSATIEG
jgi:hypothetical protein